MINNFLDIITSEDPNKILELAFQEISKQLQKNLSQHNVVFIYESTREVLKCMASSLEEYSQVKVYLRGNEEIKKSFFSGKKICYDVQKNLIRLDQSCDNADNNLLYIYPIFFSDQLIAAAGFFENNNEDKIVKEIDSYGILIHLSLETLKIKELENKVSIMEKLTEIIEKIDREEIIIEDVLCLLKDSLHAECVAFWNLSQDELVLQNFVGINEDQVLHKTLNINNSIEGRVVFEKNSFIFVGRESFENYVIPFNIDLKSSMYAKIEQNNEIYGVIATYNRVEGYDFRTYKNFDETDFSILKDSSKRLAFSIHRIKLYNKLQSEVDKLRKLKESHERLIEEQKEYLNRMNSLDKISQAVRSVYDKNIAIKIMLLGLTSGRGLKFNRALYLEKDKIRGFLVPKLWIGPDDEEDANEIWKQANITSLKYGSMVQYLKEEALRLPTNNRLTAKLENKVLAYKGHPILERVVEKKQIIHVVPQMLQIKWEDLEDIYDILKNEEFLIFPLTGMMETKSVIIVDNKINKNAITPMDIEIVKLFKDNMGLALEMIENYQELRQKTKRLEEQKDLMDYYRRFKDNILQNLALAVVVIDKSGKINEWNKKAESLFSIPRENMIGSSINELVNIFGNDIINIIEKVYETKNYLKLKNYKIEISDNERIFDIQCSPLRNEEVGVIEGVIIVLDEITELYNLQKEMQKREKLASMGEMTAKIAHEIRNPITVIGGFLNRMNKKLEDNEDIKKYTKIISEELSRLENIVNEILEYSRGTKATQIEQVNLVESIREVLMMYEDFIKQKDIMLNTEWLEEKIFINADKDKIKQVLINLIKNAIEAVDQNGKIDLKVKVEGGNVIFEITNNGTPLSDKVKENLFSPFFTTKPNGTGLGLAICKKIIEEEHKGKIYLVKSDESGTTFRFEIPIKNY